MPNRAPQKEQKWNEVGPERIWWEECIIAGQNHFGHLESCHLSTEWAGWVGDHANFSHVCQRLLARSQQEHTCSKMS